MPVKITWGPSLTRSNCSL